MDRALAALNQAMSQWIESLSREDVEEDPRSLVHRAFLEGWRTRGVFEREEQKQE